jgi:hypothetical protein
MSSFFTGTGRNTGLLRSRSPEQSRVGVFRGCDRFNVSMLVPSPSRLTDMRVILVRPGAAAAEAAHASICHNRTVCGDIKLNWVGGAPAAIEAGVLLRLR